MSEWSAFILCVVRVVQGNVGWLVVRGVWFAVSAGGGRLQCITVSAPTRRLHP